MDATRVRVRVRMRDRVQIRLESGHDEKKITKKSYSIHGQPNNQTRPDQTTTGQDNYKANNHKTRQVNHKTR
jgi:hypothetical protein